MAEDNTHLKITSDFKMVCLILIFETGASLNISFGL